MYIPLSIIVIGIICYFLFFRNKQPQSGIGMKAKSEIVPPIPDNLYKRGEEVISGLEKLLDPENTPENKAANETRIKNCSRVLERVKHDDEKLKQVVLDLETYAKDLRKFSKYRYDTYSDDPTYVKEGEIAGIRTEEMIERFKAILGDQYQDPWEEYTRVQKERLQRKK